MTAPNAIARLLAPASIAVVGATDRPGPGSDVSRAALRSVDAGVRVYLINPNREELFGHRCHPNLAALPEAPDSVIFATSPQVTLPVLNEAAARGCGAATILASGFAESSLPEGTELQAEVVRIAASAGMVVCGPNCLGVADFARGVHQASMKFAESDVGIHPRSVGVISQSGGLLIGFVNRAAARRVPLRCVVSSGNEAVTGVEDYLDAMLDDPATTVIALICEGFHDLARITTAGRRAAAAGKRIALLKLGQSARGREAVRAHTGRDGGDPAAIAQALRDAGIAMFNRTDELVEFCRIASIYPRAPGRKMAAAMVSGGAAALVCDIAARHGIALADWSAQTKAALRELLPNYATVANPLDLTGGTMLHNRAAVERAIRLIMDDPDTDALSFVFPLQYDGGSVGLRTLSELINELAPTLPKPIVVISISSGMLTGAWGEFSTKAHCALLEDVETAFVALGGWCDPSR